MLDFLLLYWKIIVVVGLIIINIVLSIIRKPKVINTIIEGINSIVPIAINDAERVLGSGNGSAKLEYAINYVLDYLGYRFNLDSKCLAKYKQYISSQIEIVLSTPQKKGESING